MRSLAISLVVFLGLAASTHAATWIVRADGSGDFPTIQAGLTGSAAGDTLELADGTYSGPGNFDLNPAGKDLVVRSQSGDPEACVIDGQDFYVHWINIDTEDARRRTAEICGRFEPLLRRIFE